MHAAFAELLDNSLDEVPHFSFSLFLTKIISTNIFPIP